MKNLLIVSSILAMIAGVMMVGIGIWGIAFTYNNVGRENITTPDDASIPETKVRGPLTLKAQADIIREHTLEMTKGQTYSEMPRQVPKLDQNGQPVLNGNGEIVMVANEGRNIWITATTLITALNLGIITYVFSSLIIFLGLISIWTSLTFFSLTKLLIK